MRKQKYFTEEERKQAKREAQKRYKEKHPEYQSNYYQKNKEKILEKMADKYCSNKDKILEYQHKYYEEHKEKIIEKHSEYYKQNKEKIDVQKSKYQIEWRKTPIGRASYLVGNYQKQDKNAKRGECTITAKWIVENIFTSKCSYCEKTDWTKLGCDRIDNSKPHTPDNVVPCCEECNIKRNKKDYKEFKSSCK